jgi:protein gp37
LSEKESDDMSDTTKIEWCDHSWSPWEGCTKVSPGCINCYAEANDQRHLFEPVDHWGPGAPRRLTKDWGKPAKLARNAICSRCGKAWPARGMHPDCEGESSDFRRASVFPSICDWLDAEVPSAWLARFLKTIHDTPDLEWMLLTKRPENFRARLEAAHAEILAGSGASTMVNRWLGSTYPGLSFQAAPPPNVWIGTSVEDQQRADERIPALLKIQARVRFISVEPLLGPVVLNHIDAEASGSAEWCQIDALTGRHTDMGRPCQDVPKLDWVIIGGESGRGARPCNVAWVRSIVQQCHNASVPCFVKQLGARCVSRNDAGFEGDTPTAWPMDTHYSDNEEPGEYQGKPVRIKLRDRKGGDPAEWPDDLRVRQFPKVYQ